MRTEEMHSLSAFAKALNEREMKTLAGQWHLGL
jgi:hypothetical protein